MSVLINRPILNRNLKRFARFLKRLDSHSNITLILSPYRSEIYRKIEEHDTLIFLNHGSKSKIFHKYDNLDKNKSQILIDEKNVKLLNSKKVFAISCKTGNILGSLCIDNGCKVYLGLDSPLEFEPDPKKFKTKRGHFYMQFLESYYKNIFYDGLNQAIEEKRTFKWLRIYYEKKFAEASKLNGINPDLINRASLRFAKIALRNLSQSFVLHGKDSEILE